MGFVAALLGKRESVVPTQIQRMLKLASPIKGDRFGLATINGVRFLSCLTESFSLESQVVLAYKLVKVLPNDPPQPLNQHGYSMVFEGRLWSRPSFQGLSTASDVIGDDPLKGIHKLIEEERGSYSVVAVERERIICGRDPVGIVPLYFGENDKLVGVASNRRMLWSMGMEPEPIPPGHLIEMTKSGVWTRPVRRVCQKLNHSISTKGAVENLDKLLKDAVEARSGEVFKASLGFSGGIDSSLIAHYLDRCGVRVDLVCVGVEGSKELKVAEETAESLGLPIHIESFSQWDVEADLDTVISRVEEPDPMKVSVALPLYWAARSVAGSSSRVFYSGNGSDELFGGYRKYVQEYNSAGERVRKMMFEDVVAAHAVNYERDYKVCAGSGMELRLPFADLRVLEFGLSLPSELILPIEKGGLRKPLLRALARSIGLPKSIYSRRKKAIQYSTGVNNALRRLAKRERSTLSRYILGRFNQIRARSQEGINV